MCPVRMHYTKPDLCANHRSGYLFYEALPNGRCFSFGSERRIKPGFAVFGRTRRPAGALHSVRVRIHADKRKNANQTVGVFLLAAREGFEPSQTESESVVLPLHNLAKRRYYYTSSFDFVNTFFKKIKRKNQKCKNPKMGALPIGKNKKQHAYACCFLFGRGRRTCPPAGGAVVGSGCHRQPFTTDPSSPSKSSQKTKKQHAYACCFFTWQGQKDLNPRHAVLETAALPTELYPFDALLL